LYLSTYKNQGQHQFKSVGTAKSARIKLTKRHLNWADLIFVMEQSHKDHIYAKFGRADFKIIVLYIEDIYEYMNKELIAILTDSIDPYL